LLLCAGLACTHARKADDASDQTTAKEEVPEQEADPQEKAQSPDPQAVNGRKGLIAGGAKDPERVPVASSPTGLLKPGADEKVRGKLGAGAKGDGLRPALQRFQREHDLPATGILDHRTAKELGLDPDEIFERAAD
jgi:Putative peptidoglycan binding domain